MSHTRYVPRICPECAAGKHVNCSGDAWNDETDQIDTCQCTEGLCA